MKKLLQIFNSFAINKDGKRLGKKNISVLVALFSLAFVNTNQAQVATNYTWSQATGSYISITGGTVVASGASIDDSNYTVNLPTGFTFNGANYTSVRFVSNGYIAFGNHTSTATYSAISSTDTANGIVCAMAMDLISTVSTSEMRWQEIGNEIIFQWKQFSRFGVTGESFSFQIVLNTFTGEIKAVYDGSTSIATGTTRQPQVGLRGTANTDYLARRLTTTVPDAAPAWNDTAAATTNAHTVRFTSTSVAAYPSAGHTYIWSPVSASVDWANLQWISNSTPYPCQSVDVYTQGYEPGLTNASSTSAGTGISVWIGTMASATDSDPSLWPESAWVAATYNTDSGSNDEFKRTISGLAVGSYRVASRWKISNGTFRYGATNNNFYNGTTSLTGLIAVTALPAITATATPSAPVCAGTSVTLAATSAGSYTYAWDNGAGTGASVTVSPTATTTYTVTGTDTVSGCTNTATVTVTINPSPVAIDITNADATICQDAIQTITTTGGSVTGATATASSGTVNLAIPDNILTTGVAQTLAVSGVPAGATITKVDVLLNITHTFDGDLRINLEGPNGQIINLVNQAGGAVANFTNTVVTSNTAATAFSAGTAPYTGTFKADLASQATIGTTPAVTSTTFSSLYTVPNGNWKVRVYDDASLDTGTLNNCSITITYDVPATITWSPTTDLFTDLACTTGYTGGNTATVYAKPSATVTYTATATVGSCTKTDTVTYTVATPLVASIASNNGPTVCNATNAVFNLTGTAGATVTYTINAGANQTVVLTGGVATVTITGITTTQTLALVSVTDGTCTKTLSGSSVVSVGATTTWTITAPATTPAWDNGAPTSTMTAIIAANYSESANINACSLTVNNNAVVSIPSGFNVNLSNTITVASGSSFTLNNNANLFQSNAAAVNTGNIIVKRQTNPLIRLDYTLWSSPVTGQGLYAFSPFTFDNRFYVYNTTSNLYNNSSIGFTITGLNGAGVNGTDTANVSFATGKGYLIRLPYNHPTAPIIFNGSFTGVPNNGTKTITLANVSATQQFNAVGNPYPSPIDIDQFATDNASNIESTLYFWRKTNNAASPSYCTWNTASSTFGDNGEAYTTTPNGVIQTGQGFIVEAKDGATSLEFNNGQRVADNANQFFRANTTATPTNESHRVWLNLTGTGGAYSQAVVGYFTNATSGADAYDSKYFNDGAIALNMVIGSTEYVIQGRPTFQATDIVPLNYKVTTAGNYTFAIDHVDGLFTGGAQAIYIKDNQDGSYHNLSAPYTFTSTAGTFANRFELVYQTALATNDNSFTANSINVIKQQNDVVVRTAGTTMQEVTIYDIRGRVLVTKNNINASETKINVGTTNQVLLVQVTTTEGIKATKKVVN